MKTLETIKSSAARSVAYDPDTRTLRVDWTNGGPYDYHGVAQGVVDALQTAESVGRYLLQVVRPMGGKRVQE